MFNKIISKVMIMVFCCLCLMPVCAVSVALAADPSVVFFTDFENNKVGELPEGWVGVGKVVTDKAYSGKISLFTEDKTTTEYGELILPAFAAKPNAIYEVSAASIVTDVNTVGSLAIYVAEKDKDGKVVQWFKVFMEKTDYWTETYKQITVSDKAAFLELYIYAACNGKAGTGDAWIDDLKVTQVQ